MFYFSNYLVSSSILVSNSSSTSLIWNIFSCLSHVLAASLKSSPVSVYLWEKIFYRVSNTLLFTFTLKLDVFVVVWLWTSWVLAVVSSYMISVNASSFSVLRIIPPNLPSQDDKVSYLVWRLMDLFEACVGNNLPS